MGLPLTVELAKEEPATSFLRRIAARNGCSGIEFCRDFDLDHSAIREGRPNAIAELAALGGADADRIAAWTPQRTGKATYTLKGYGFLPHVHLSSEIRICSDCVAERVGATGLRPAEAAVQRATWLFTYTSSCLRHGCGLIDLPQLNRLSWSLSDLPRPEPVEVPVFDEWFSARLAGLTGSIWLDGHNPFASAEFCDLIGRRIAGSDLSYSRARAREAAKSVSLGFAIVRQGERRLKDEFTDWQAQPWSARGRFGCYGPVYSGLNRRKSHADYADFCRILREHIFDTLSIGADVEVLGEHLKTRRIHSVATAAQETGLSQHLMRSILVEQGLVEDKTRGKSNKHEVFQACAARELLSRIRVSVTTETLRCELRISSVMFTALRASGLLRPSVITRQSPLWDIAAARGLLEKLSQTEGPIPADEAGWVPLAAGAARVRFPLEQLLLARLAGELPPFRLRSGQSGFASLLIAKDELRAFCALAAVNRGSS